MKKVFLLVLVASFSLALLGCAPQQTPSATPALSYADGQYRGAYVDSGYNHLSLSFKLKDNIVQEIEYRHLEYKGVDYIDEETDEAVVGIRGQYEELAQHLVGKDIRESLADLYEPGNIAEDIDAFSAATLDSGKIISSVRDALNRGAYRLPK